MAVALAEPGWKALLDVLGGPRCVVPAPVITELKLAASRRRPATIAAADFLLDNLLASGAQVASFQRHHAELTGPARDRYGKGNGRGGLLNFGDLMVYAIAKEGGQPLLCTGRDFVSTDLEIHPASRIDA